MHWVTRRKVVGTSENRPINQFMSNTPNKQGEICDQSSGILGLESEVNAKVIAAFGMKAGVAEADCVES